MRLKEMSRRSRQKTAVCGDQACATHEAAKIDQEIRMPRQVDRPGPKWRRRPHFAPDEPPKPPPHQAQSTGVVVVQFQRPGEVLQRKTAMRWPLSCAR